MKNILNDAKTTGNVFILCSGNWLNRSTCIPNNLYSILWLLKKMCIGYTTSHGRSDWNKLDNQVKCYETIHILSLANLVLCKF